MSRAVLLAAGALHNGEVPLGEAIAFWILGPVSLAGGIGMVLFRNAVHSALSLVATMMRLGAFYVIQQGPFLGLVQIIVYTGAIMILFLFVLMLVGRDSSDSIVETLRGQRWAAALFGRRLRAARRAVASAARSRASSRPTSTRRTRTAATSTRIARAAVHQVPVRLRADLGAADRGRRRRDGAGAHRARGPQAHARRSLARERIRSGRPQPLPGPGVLSTGNSIGTPALLPDGTISRESVMVAAAEDLEPRPRQPARARDRPSTSDSEIRS